MEKTLFEKLCEKYELATNVKLDPKRISLGNDASWTTHKALESLEYEPNGNLGVLLLYKAWQEQKSQAHIKLNDLLANPNWIQHIQEFEKELNEGDAYKLLSKTIEVTEKIANRFDINNVHDLLVNDTTKFIDLFAEAYENIYKTYVIDRFACNENKGCGEPYIGLHEYHFHSLIDFVNCLRRSENCIIYARIDGLHNYDDADEYDTFFAFGVRCEDKVYINSDRENHATPESRNIKKTRNPGKKLRNKANNTWMPYYDLRNNKPITTDTALMVINPSIVPPSKISELYDDEAKLMIALSIATIYEKYFINKVRSEIRYQDIKHGRAPIEDTYFGEEIKLLPPSSNIANAIVKYNEIQLPAITMNQLTINNPNISCSDVTFFDWYIKEYIKEDDITTPAAIEQFIGNKEDAERRVWWQYRDEARRLVNERRTKEIASMYAIWDKNGNQYLFDIDLCKTNNWGEPMETDWKYLNKNRIHWLTHKLPSITHLKDFNAIDKLKNNLPHIFKIMLEDECSGYFSYHRLKNTNAYTDSYYHTEAKKYPSSEPSDNIEDGNFPYCDLHVMLKSEKASASEFRWWDNRGGSDFKHREYDPETDCYIYYNKGNPDEIYGYRNDIIIIPANDSKNKNFYFKLKAGNYWDLCNLLGCRREDLPKPLQRWLHGSKPYTGNSILNVCDPMDDVFDWVDECFEFELTFYLSKSDINKLCKKYDIKLGIRNRSKDEDDD